VKIEKRFLTDENLRPIAVVIDYETWREIERKLGDGWPEKPGADLTPFIGTLKSWPEDPVEYQRRIRDEWED